MYKLIKPWGEESTWTKTGNYEAKILHINTGEKLSTKYHKQKDFSILIEVGTPQADDAVRISDAYGRICDGD